MRIEVLRFEVDVAPHEMSAVEKITHAESKKQLGNALHAETKYNSALRQYDMVCACSFCVHSVVVELTLLVFH
jgi:hypothetical protein